MTSPQPTSARTTPVEPLRIAMIGTRGVPANYGGFETAVEEIGCRLVDRGHAVTVYCRGGKGAPRAHLGMDLVQLPALRLKAAETLSHTALSTVHAVLHAPDVAFVFNAANSPFVPLLRARRVPVALHMDGLEWQRAKWGPTGQRYYRAAETFGVRTADAWIADAPGIADYYRTEFGVPTEQIAYGAAVHEDLPTAPVTDLGLEAGGYHLVVARFEPENHVREIVQGYARSKAEKPLVVVGSAPYAAEYSAAIDEIAGTDSRIRLLGGVWDQDLLDALYHHAYTYLHGHSVGGTNPSLLRATGSGTFVIAYDVSFNSAIVGDHGFYFSTADDAAGAIERAEADPQAVADGGSHLRAMTAREYVWDDVATAYENLARRLVGGESRHRLGRRARRRSITG